MSELNNDLNEEVTVVVEDADVITVPIDTTLSNSGEAADAKAVGDALALKADASSVVAIDVNGQGADLQGHIIIDGTDIEMSSTDDTTLKAAIEAAGSRTGADIQMSSEDTQTLQSAISDAASRTATDIPMSSATGAAMISAKISAMDVVANANSSAIDELEARTGDSILLNADGTQTISAAVAERVKTVNGTGPDSSGNVQVEHALTADNLTSSESQNNVGEWVRRTSGGTASIPDGDAWLSIVRGNRTHVGYSAEVLNWDVVNAPREQGQAQLTATFDRATFIAYVSGSGTYTMTYTTSWDTDPALYGFTVSGTPVAGDQIVVQYTAEQRGTIYQSSPKKMISTGWNLYNHELTYAIGLKYAETAMFKVEGTYTAVKYSATTTGTKTTLVPVDGYFTIDANGYIWIEGGNDTDTAVYMCWKDWDVTGPSEWAEYTEDEIDMSDLFDEEGCPFPYGLLRVGEVRDEINFNTGMAVSRVERLDYSAENLEAAEESGRVYEYDTNYIYLERAAAVETEIEIDGQYVANDHGLEYFTDTSVAAYAVIIYGNSLKNKLERDVLTKSQDLIDNLTTDDGTKALSAKQGKALYDTLSAMGTIVTKQYGNTTSFAINVGNSEVHFLVVSTSNGTGCFAVFVATTSGGGISILQVAKGSAITIGTSTNNKLTISSTLSSRRYYVTDFVLVGNPITLTAS